MGLRHRDSAILDDDGSMTITLAGGRVTPEGVAQDTVANPEVRHRPTWAKPFRCEAGAFPRAPS